MSPGKFLVSWFPAKSSVSPKNFAFLSKSTFLQLTPPHKARGADFRVGGYLWTRNHEQTRRSGGICYPEKIWSLRVLLFAAYAYSRHICLLEFFIVFFLPQKQQKSQNLSSSWEDSLFNYSDHKPHTQVRQHNRHNRHNSVQLNHWHFEPLTKCQHGASWNSDKKPGSLPPLPPPPPLVGPLFSDMSSVRTQLMQRGPGQAVCECINIFVENVAYVPHPRNGILNHCLAQSNLDESLIEWCQKIGKA